MRLWSIGAFFALLSHSKKLEVGVQETLIFKTREFSKNKNNIKYKLLAWIRFFVF